MTEGVSTVGDPSEGPPEPLLDLFTRESAFELVLSPPSSRRSPTPSSCR